MAAWNPSAWVAGLMGCGSSPKGAPAAKDAAPADAAGGAGAARGPAEKAPEGIKRLVLVLKPPRPSDASAAEEAKVTRRAIVAPLASLNAARRAIADHGYAPRHKPRELTEKQQFLLKQVAQQNADAARAERVGCYMASGLRKGYKDSLDAKYTFALVQPSRKVAQRDLKQFFASFTCEGSELYDYMEAICTARSAERESFRGFVVGLLRNARSAPVAAVTLRLGPLVTPDQSGGGGDSAAVVPRFHHGVRYMEVPFFATFPRYRGEGHTLRLLSAVETLAVRCSCTHLILPSVPDGPHATTNFWCQKYGFRKLEKEELAGLGAREGAGMHGTTIVALEDTIPLVKSLAYTKVMAEGNELAARVAKSKEARGKPAGDSVTWGEAVLTAGVFPPRGTAVAAAPLSDADVPAPIDHEDKSIEVDADEALDDQSTEPCTGSDSEASHGRVVEEPPAKRKRTAYCAT